MFLYKEVTIFIFFCIFLYENDKTCFKPYLTIPYYNMYGETHIICLEYRINVCFSELVPVFRTAPLVKRGRDQHMAIFSSFFSSHLLDQSEQSRIIKAPL